MRVLVVSSPHGYTTRDVWFRAMEGLRQNGVDVVPFDLLTRWRVFDWMIETAKKKKLDMPPGFMANLLSYEPIFGSAHFHECDAVMIISPQYCPSPLVDMLRKAGKKTIAYFTECPYEDGIAAPEMAPHFDYVCVNDRNSINLFRSFVPNPIYVPHSFDPKIHYPADESEREGIVFVGTMYRDRIRFLKQVNWESIPLEIYGLHKGIRKNSRMASFIRGDLQDNEVASAIYRRALGGFGIHRRTRFGFADWEIDDGEAYSAGPRVYELAACGTFQVSDYREEIEDIFGDAVPFYRTPKELEATLRRAVDDPVWRSEMAERQREAVQGRDCKATMATVLESVA